MNPFIFDMDGVIVDTEKYWQSAETGKLKEWLPKWGPEDQEKIIGMHIDDIYQFLISEYSLKISYVDFSREVNQIADNIYKNQCALIPGFKELITTLKEKGVKIGLASSSKREWIDIILDRFNLRKFFNITVSAQEIDGPGKPAPDIYLHTAKLLNTIPENCWVIEDSNHGVCAAKAAHMKCIGFRNGINLKTDLSKADIEIEGFKDFNFTLLN